jgi:hypothetical protein
MPSSIRAETTSTVTHGRRSSGSRQHGGLVDHGLQPPGAVDDDEGVQSGLLRPSHRLGERQARRHLDARGGPGTPRSARGSRSR